MPYDDLFGRVLSEPLRELEAWRRPLAIRLLLLLPAVVAINLAVLAALVKYEFPGVNLLFAVFLISLPGLPVYLHIRLTRDYRTAFKDRIVRHVLKSLDPDFYHVADKGIPYDFFEASLLHPHLEPHTYRSEDLIVLARRDGRAFAFGEASARKKGCVAAGFMGVALSGLRVESPVVLKSRAHRIEEGTFNKQSYPQFYREAHGLQEVVTGDRDFDSTFLVFAASFPAFVELFDQDRCQALVAFTRDLEGILELSFVEDRLYLFLHTGSRNLFDPPVYRKISPARIRKDFVMLEAMSRIRPRLGLPDPEPSDRWIQDLHSVLTENPPLLSTPPS